MTFSHSQGAVVKQIGVSNTQQLATSTADRQTARSVLSEEKEPITRFTILLAQYSKEAPQGDIYTALA
jgi:hypothetical protein